MTFCECESFFFILQIGIPFFERIKYMYNKTLIAHLVFVFTANFSSTKCQNTVKISLETCC